MTVDDLKVQLDLLTALNSGLEDLTIEGHIFVTGLSICLHRPDNTPMDPLSANSHSQSWITDDGCLHLITHNGHVAESIRDLDLDRAELLTRLHAFWQRRASELRISMAALFNVEDVLFDMSDGFNIQRFVLWAGCIMANRCITQSHTWLTWSWDLGMPLRHGYLGGDCL